MKITPPKPNEIQINLPLVISLLVIIVSISVSGYFYLQYKKATSQSSAKQEAEKLYKQIGKIVLLPDEFPTLATVTDKSKLQQQSFYKNAENGDKVLIFKKAKKAILYRPGIGKVIEMAPISVPDEPLTEKNLTQQATGEATISLSVPSPTTKLTTTPTPAKAVSLALYNSTQTSGLTRKAEEELKNKVPDVVFEVISRGNSQGDYEKTLVVDLAGKNTEVAKKIAQALGGTTGPLPPDETKPTTDILIILGSDYSSK